MGLNCVWLLAFDESCGCNVIALRLQAYHLVAVKKQKPDAEHCAAASGKCYGCLELGLRPIL